MSAEIDVGEHLMEMSRTLGEIKATVSAIDKKLDAHVKSDDENFEDHDRRIKRGEALYFKVFGGATVLTVIVQVAWKVWAS